MMKGLFGKRQTWQTPGIGDGLPGVMQTPYSMPQDMGIEDGANLGVGGASERPRGFWQGGDKFTFRDGLAGALAVIGDSLSSQSGGGVGAVGNLIQSRMMPMQEAARIAAEQRKRAADLADYRVKKGIDAEFETPKMDEFDAAMARAGIPKGSPQYVQYARDFAQRKAQGGDETVVVPIPGRGTFVGPRSALGQALGMGGGAQDAPDTLPADFFKGGTGGNVGGNF